MIAHACISSSGLVPLSRRGGKLQDRWYQFHLLPNSMCFCDAVASGSSALRSESIDRISAEKAKGDKVIARTKEVARGDGGLRILGPGRRRSGARTLTVLLQIPVEAGRLHLASKSSTAPPVESPTSVIPPLAGSRVSVKRSDCRWRIYGEVSANK